MTNKETERVIKKFPIMKSPGPGDFTGKFPSIYRNNTNSLQTLPKKEEERTYQVHPMSQNQPDTKNQDIIRKLQTNMS